MSLWTNIRDAVTGAIPTVVGGLVGGPAGAIIGAAVGATGGTKQQTLLPMPSVSQPGPGGGGSTPWGMAQTAGTVPRLLGPAMGALGRWIVGARGLVTSGTGVLLGVMRGTKLFRNAQVLQLAKQVGIEAAAVALGVTVVDVAQMIAAHYMRRGRRHRTRGITGRDIKCTRRTMRKFHSLARLFHSTTTHARRRPGSGATLIRQG